MVTNPIQNANIKSIPAPLYDPIPARRALAIKQYGEATYHNRMLQVEFIFNEGNIPPTLELINIMCPDRRIKSETTTNPKPFSRIMRHTYSL